MGGRDLFKNLLVKMGKGGTTANLKLDRSEYLPGETVRGELKVDGGLVTQQINEIEVELLLVIRANEKPFRHTLHKSPIGEPFSLPPDTWRTFPFSCRLPEDLPVSGKTVTYSLVTRLDIEGGMDHTNQNYIRIQPPPRLQPVLRAFSQLGFREKYGSRTFNGYTQEFMLFPTRLLQSQVKEIRFAATMEEKGVRLLLEVDAISSAAEKEILRELYLENQLLDQEETLKKHLADRLTETVEHPTDWQQTRPSRHKHQSLSRAGLVGGFAADVLGPGVLSELGEEEKAHPEEGREL